MKVEELGPFYPRWLENVKGLTETDNLWRDDAAALLAEEPPTDTDACLEYLHQLQRLNNVAVGGLASNQAFRDAVTAQPIPSWKDFTAPPAALELQHSLAEKLYNVDPAKDKYVLVNIGDGSREIGEWIVDKLMQDGVSPQIYFFDSDFMAFALNHADDDGVKALSADYVETTEPATKVITSRSGQRPRILATPAPDKYALYAREMKSYSQRISSGELFYTLTVIPTPKDAELDGIPYEDYTRLFFEMVDQPISAISAAQQSLIREFNAASNVRITNSDGTDLRMSLVDHDGSHFTFCNSLVAKNVPGSEIFSAPRLDSVEGTIVAKGKFQTPVGSHVIENLTMTFHKGRLEEFSAEKGEQHFGEALRDEGARYVGELGIGTNPHLQQHVLNSLLVEKIGGSFHIALGKPYSFTEYEGEPVKVNNGGDSNLHWDITTMLHGKQGRIYLDDRLVMDNGKWLDPKYDVLNRGWAAIPEENRPDYWKGYNGPEV